MKKRYSAPTVVSLLMIVVQLFIFPMAYAIEEGSSGKQNNLKTLGRRTSPDTSAVKTEFLDLYSDTWVATDALEESCLISKMLAH
jgi:hypothetical protein